MGVRIFRSEPATVSVVPRVIIRQPASSPPKEISSSESQAPKTSRSSSSRIPFGSAILESEEQPEKASKPITSTPTGRMRVASEEQPRKAPLPIFFNLAAKIAKEYDIRIYTIGFRTDKEIVETPYGLLNNSEFDEKTLKSIASVTGGEYFRSSSKSSLIDIYNEIDQLERTKLEIKHFGDQEERFMIFAFIAIVSLMLEILLRNTVLKTIP